MGGAVDDDATYFVETDPPSLDPELAMTTRILAVCLGNICRSPVAEAAIREAAEQAGLDVEVDSAGTGAWHVGNPPDTRMVAAGADEGLEVGGRARKVAPSDLSSFDLVVAMDRENLDDLRAIAASTPSTATIRLLREFDPDADGVEVPDPYYGGDDGFRRVVEMMRPAAAGVVEWVRLHGRGSTGRG